MIGKVIEGRYVGASICKLPEKNVLFIETEDGERIALSKKNAISIDDVTNQYPSYGGKVMMVMWNDFETSLFLLGKSKISSVTSDEHGVIIQGKTSHSNNLKKRHITHIIISVFVILFMIAGVMLWYISQSCMLSHNWEDANCMHPKTCNKCGLTEGNIIDHEYDWTIVSDSTDLNCGEQVGVCKACQSTINESIPAKTPLLCWKEEFHLSSGISIICSPVDILAQKLEIYSDTMTSEEILNYLRNESRNLGFDHHAVLSKILLVMNSGSRQDYPNNRRTLYSLSEFDSLDGKYWNVAIGGKEHKGYISVTTEKKTSLESLMGISLDKDKNQGYTPPSHVIAPNDNTASEMISLLYDEFGNPLKADSFLEIYETILSTAYKRYYGKTLSIRKAPGSQLSNSYGIYIDGEPSGAMINFMYKGDDTPSDNSFDQIILMAYTDSGDDTGSNIFCLTTLMSAAKPTVSDVMDSTSIFEEMLYELNEPGVDFSEYTVQGVKYKMSILPVENRPTMIFSIDISALQ